MYSAQIQSFLWQYGETTEEDNNRPPGAGAGGEEEDQPLQRGYCVSLQDAMFWGYINYVFIICMILN